MAFQKAEKQVAFAKMGAFGPTGSGKTTWLAMMLLYISKEYCGGKPVAMLDTEKGSDFVLPMFEKEGVDLLVNKTRAFVDLRNAHKDALSDGACALGIDSVTHFWQELLTAIKTEKNVKRLSIDLIGMAKDQWHVFTEAYVTSPLHYLMAGRLGNEWDNADVEDENGKIKTELVKGGTKMKAEGDTGYEPDVLIELSSADDPNAADYKKLTRGGRMKKLASRQIHVALVKKGRVWDLNGKMFTWPDADTYKPGDYKIVGDCFAPYFKFLNLGGAHQAFDNSRNSQALFAGNGDGDHYRRQRDKQIAIETWQATMNAVLPGQDANSKRARAVVGESITGLRSQTAFESQTLEKIQDQVATLLAFESIVKDAFPTSNEEILGALEQAKHTVHPATIEEQVRLTGEAF